MTDNLCCSCCRQGWTGSQPPPPCSCTACHPERTTKKIDCLCGQGDDGKHRVDETVLGRFITCPYVEPGTLWGFDDRYIKFMVKNIATAGEVEKR